jgi:hypothetical protein
MSLKPMEIPPVPEETARVARAAFPRETNVTPAHPRRSGRPLPGRNVRLPLFRAGAAGNGAVAPPGQYIIGTPVYGMPHLT